MRTVFVVSTLVLAGYPGILAAQGFCPFPRPRPRCAFTTVTEVSGMLGLSKTQGETRTALEAAFGLTYNLSPRFALSGMASLGYANPGQHGYQAVRARVRTWLSPSMTVDVSPGLIVGGVTSRTLLDEYPSTDVWVHRLAVTHGPGLTMDAAAGIADWLAVFVRTDVVWYDMVYEATYQWDENYGAWFTLDEGSVGEQGSIVDVFFGARVGSYPGFALQIASLLGFLIWAASYHGD